MTRLADHFVLLILVFSPSLLVADPLQSGPQPGKRVPGIFCPVAVHYAAHPDKKGERINPLCHYGQNPTLMVFARDVGPELQRLVKRLDGEAGRHKGFRFAACIILLTDDEPVVAVKKLRGLFDDGKIERVTLAYFASAGPVGYDIAQEAEWTVLHYERYKVTANQALEKSEVNEKAVDRVIADIDTIVPAIKVWSGIGLAPGDSQSLKIIIRRDRVKGPVTLRLADPPEGVSAGEVTVPANESEGWLPITADQRAPLGEWPATAVVTTGKMRMEVKVSIWVRMAVP